MLDNEPLSEKANELSNLLESQRTLLLATASPTGIPDLSYAPFVRDKNGRFYIFISELAAHTAYILINPQASVLIIRPESETKNLFARERATFECNVAEIARNELKYAEILDALQNHFGDIIVVLRSLSDFHLFVLTPVSGRYVAGFGQAYTIDLQTGGLSPLIKKHR